MPTFPNAKYILSRRDFEQALSPELLDQPGYNENVLPIVEAGQAEIVDSNYEMDDNFWLEPTPGHTAGHVAVGMISRGVEAVMCGDLMHSPIQCLYPEWNAASDVDPSKAARTRRTFLDDNCERNRLVMTAHFPEPSMGRILQADNAFKFDSGGVIQVLHQTADFIEVLFVRRISLMIAVGCDKLTLRRALTNVRFSDLSD